MSLILQHSLLGIVLILMSMVILTYSLVSVQATTFFCSIFLISIIVAVIFLHLWHHKSLSKKILYFNKKSFLIAEIQQPLLLSSLFPFHHLLSCFLYRLEFIARIPSRPHQKNIFSVQKYSKSHNLYLSFPYRGFYNVNGCLKISDIFGLFHSSIQLPNVWKILIAPAIPKIENCSICSLNMKNQNKKSDPLYEIEKTRQYYPGDHLRRIHWGLSSRFQQLFVREKESKNPEQQKVEEKYYVLFPPPLDKDAPYILDYLIQEMLKILMLNQTHSSQTHLIIGSLLVKSFDLYSLTLRAQLAYAYAGMTYTLNEDNFKQEGTWTFLGCAHDKNFIKAIKEYYHYTPKIFIKNMPMQDQTINNLRHLTKKFNLETDFV